MSKLKPQLIITGSHKKKGGFASGIGSFLVLLIVFVLGVYVGTKVDTTKFGAEPFQESSRVASSSLNDESVSETIVAPAEQQAYSETRVENIPTSPESLEPTNQNLNQEIGIIDNDNYVVDDTNDPSFNESTTTISGLDDNSRNEIGLLTTTLDNQPEQADDSYRLQVAAFSSLEDANQYVESLKLKGYEAYTVTSSNSRGEVWNLIKIGDFKTAEDAWNFSAVYQTNEGGEVFVESLNRGRIYRESIEEDSPEPINIQQ